MEKSDSAHQHISTAVILAGGKGTRLGLVDKPKPMALVNGIPLLEYHIRAFAQAGVQQIFLLCGHQAQVIFRYFGDGSKWNVHIHYSIDPEPLGTMGCLSLVKAFLNKTFYFDYGDVYWNMDLSCLSQFHFDNHSDLTIVSHPSNHPFDSDLLSVDQNQVQQIYFKNQQPPYFDNLACAGFYVVNPCVLEHLPFGIFGDFLHDFVYFLVGKYRVLAYQSAEYIKDMGTPERLEKLEQDLRTHKTQAAHKAIFLDRDGVVNTYVPDLVNPEEFVVNDQLAQCIGQWREQGFLVIIITNQPAIAKGWLSYEALHKMHQILQTHLAHQGQYIDRIYFCPHHPDSGFPGEIPSLKKKCACRKPAPGLFIQAQKDYQIQWERSYMIGDAFSDAQGAYSLGIKPLVLKNDQIEQERVQEMVDQHQAEGIFDSLEQACQWILNDQAP